MRPFTCNIAFRVAERPIRSKIAKWEPRNSHLLPVQSVWLNKLWTQRELPTGKQSCYVLLWWGGRHDLTGSVRLRQRGRLVPLLQFNCCRPVSKDFSAYLGFLHLDTLRGGHSIKSAWSHSNDSATETCPLEFCEQPMRPNSVLFELHDGWCMGSVGDNYSQNVTLHVFQR